MREPGESHVLCNSGECRRWGEPRNVQGRFGAGMCLLPHTLILPTKVLCLHLHSLEEEDATREMYANALARVSTSAWCLQLPGDERAPDGDTEGTAKRDLGAHGSPPVRHDETLCQVDMPISRLVKVMAVCHHEAAVHQAHAVVISRLAEQTLVLERTLPQVVWGITMGTPTSSEVRTTQDHRRGARVCCSWPTGFAERAVMPGESGPSPLRPSAGEHPSARHAWCHDGGGPWGHGADPR